MEKVSRKENKLLNRVEIAFKWKHDGKSTPSRKEVMDLVVTLEPGAKSDLIVVNFEINQIIQISHTVR